MPNPEVVEIDGWTCTQRSDFFADAVRGEWTVSLKVDLLSGAVELDIDCKSGATGCYLPLTVVQQLQKWDEESKARRSAGSSEE